MKRQEKADLFCLGSRPIRPTAAQQFDAALAEHVCTRLHIYDTFVTSFPLSVSPSASFLNV